ncbi:MAG TPA: bifunctional demethylmenaquinone methyltransferase/2-methoxy-6-polyprenyl-1,4-benzoquinol methylase UbiE [Dehalococcoidia bacterium]|nr:bifunctional demethylmenaquinone methyltransferase/2-methoxy-6-polyprenyl-1,4-benzoquinol methylase UbiE [Dehalococcoidia bacterium]
MNDPLAPEAPHGEPRIVAAMFGRIAGRYDLMNRLLSLGMDGGWRKLAAKEADLRPGDRALDVASGTGDLAFEMAKRVGDRGFVVGLDITHEMLVLGHAKSVERNEHGVDHHEGDAMNLPYADRSFRAATMAFGGRNVPDLTGAFREMTRVLQPGGRVVFLELNRPKLPGFKQLFDWYFHTFSPLVGGLISGDRSAYEYLPRSVDKFEDVEDIKKCMVAAGLRDVRVHALMFGVANVHIGTRPPDGAQA